MQRFFFSYWYGFNFITFLLNKLWYTAVKFTQEPAKKIHTPKPAHRYISNIFPNQLPAPHIPRKDSSWENRANFRWYWLSVFPLWKTTTFLLEIKIYTPGRNTVHPLYPTNASFFPIFAHFLTSKSSLSKTYHYFYLLTRFHRNLLLREFFFSSINTCVRCNGSGIKVEFTFILSCPFFYF